MTAPELIHPATSVQSSPTKMTRRRNAQQKKNTEDGPSATELTAINIDNMSEREFRLTIIQAIARLEKAMDDQTELIRAELKATRQDVHNVRAELKATREEVHNALNEFQSNLNSLKARVTETEDRISDLEDKQIERKDQEEAWNKQLRSHESRIREISDAMKRSNVRIIGIPEGEEKERSLEDVVEQVLHENFPNLANETSVHVLEAERSPPKIIHSKKTSRHLIVKLRNYNCRYNLLKAARAKRLLTYRGKPIRITSDLSTETWQARRGWQDIFRALNEKNMQPRILYPARLTFKMDGEIKSFQDRQGLKDYATTKPILQEILRGVL